MKKVLVVLGSLMGVVLIIALGAIIFFVNNMPEPGVINEALKTQKNSKAVATPSPSFATSNDQTATPPTTKEIETEKEAKNKEINEYIFKTLRKEDPSDIQVCQNLGNKTTVEDNMDDVLLKGVTEQGRTDPRVEVWRSYIKALFHSKPVDELFTEIEKLDSVPKEEREALFEKLNFYSYATKKAYEIYSNKKEYEELADRMFHLDVIAQVVNKRPELRNDYVIQKFCNELQSSISQKKQADIDEERKEILKLIDYAKLTPQELNFDPTRKSTFNMEIKERNLSFGITHPGQKL